jgi:hypothetical protein
VILISTNLHYILQHVRLQFYSAIKKYSLAPGDDNLKTIFERASFSYRDDSDFRSPPSHSSSSRGSSMVDSGSTSSIFTPGVLHSTDVSPSSYKKRVHKSSVIKHLDRKLTEVENREINLNIARFIYSSGIAMHHVNNPFLKAALTALNKTFRNGTTDWNIRNHLLDDVSAEVAEKVDKVLNDCKWISVLSDGWSGVQKKHLLNIILQANGVPIFAGNIYTDESSVNGEYQFEKLKSIIDKNGGVKKVAALVTDNASVMRKTWRLTRKHYNGDIWTYGCTPHGLNLLFKDILNKIPKFKKVEQLAKKITKHFNKVLQLGGLATFKKYQNLLKLSDDSISSRSLKHPVITRWGSSYTCIESVIENLEALKMTVISSKSTLAVLLRVVVSTENSYQFLCCSGCS